MPVNEAAVAGGYRPPVGPGVGSDAGSTGGYQAARANAFKSTPAYYRAVAQVLATQAPHQQAAVARGALHNPSLEGKAALVALERVNPEIVRQARDAMVHAGRGPSLLDQLGEHPGNTLAGLVGDVQGVGNDLMRSPVSGPEGRLSVAGVSGGGRIGRTVWNAAGDVGQAFAHDPVGTTTKTVTGGAEMAAGGAAGLIGLPIQTVADIAAGRTPIVSTLGRLAQKEGENLDQRYGPIYNANNPQQLAAANTANVARIQQQGAAPEAADALLLAGGADATLGKLVGRTGKKWTGDDSYFNRARPDLRVSGQEARKQNLSNNIGRMSAQRAEDKLRGRFGQGRGTNLVRPGEVGTLTSGRYFGEGVKKFISAQQAQSRQKMEKMLDRLVRRGSRKAADGLTKDELHAAPILTEGFVPVRPRPGETMAALKDRAMAALANRAQRIVSYRAAHPDALGNHIPDQFRSKVDELERIREMQANPDGWLTANMADFLDAHAANSRLADEAQPGGYLMTETARARVNRPVMEQFGYRHPDEAFEDFNRESRAGDKMAVKDSRGDLREHTSRVNALKTRLALAKQQRDITVRNMPRAGFVPKDQAVIAARRAVVAAESAVRERTALHEGARRAHDVLMERVQRTGLPHIPGMAEARAAEDRASAAIDAIERRLAKAREQHERHVGRLEGRLGPGRGTGKPLLPTVAARLEARQRQVAKFEDALAAAHDAHRDAQAHRDELSRTDPREIPLPARSAARIDRAQMRLAHAHNRMMDAHIAHADAKRTLRETEAASSPAELPLSSAQQARAWAVIHSHDDRVRSVQDALSHAQGELKATREYNRVAESNAGRSVKTGQSRADRIRERTFLKTREVQMAHYNALADQLREEHGLPPASFFKHNVSPKLMDGSYAANNGARAMGAPKHTTFSAWRSGIVDRSPRMMFDSLAHQIKGAHQWQLHHDLVSRNHLPMPNESEIAAAGFAGKSWHDLTGFQLGHVMAHMGLDLSKIRFLNPGRLRESFVGDTHGIPGEMPGAEMEGGVRNSGSLNVLPELSANSRLAHALNQDNNVRALESNGSLYGLDKEDPFVKTTGWMPFTKDAFDEIQSSATPTGRGSRILGKVGQVQGLGMLGANPAFVQYNTLAHALLAAFATRGRLPSEAAKAYMHWRGLDQAARDAIDRNHGGRGVFRMDRIGSEDLNGFRAFMQNMSESRAGRMLHSVNPIHAMFHVEDMQSTMFRRIAFYSHAKRVALQNLSQNLSLAEKAALRFSHAWTVGPKDEMLRIINSVPEAEELGRHVVNMMGDYSRFSHAERSWLNNKAVLFYAFMRHVLRNLFYVLPVKHPIATALTAQLGNLHNDEIRKLFAKSGAQPLPWDYSRVMWDNNGHPTSIDFARSAPVGGLLSDIATQGAQGASTLIQPAFEPLLNMIYKHTPDGTPFPASLWSMLATYISQTAPGRLAATLRFGTKEQQADSVPFLHERPKSPKTAAARAYEAAKEQASGPAWERLLSELTIAPRPDDSVVVAQHRAKKPGRSLLTLPTLPSLQPPKLPAP